MYRIYTVALALLAASYAVAQEVAPAGPVTFKLRSNGAMMQLSTGNKAAWAGEFEEPKIQEDKAAFAGLDNHFRVALNAVRISDGVGPLEPHASLKLAAFRLAKGLATDDKPDAIDPEALNAVGLTAAKEEGLTAAKDIKVFTITEEPSANRKVTDLEPAAMSAITKWTAPESKDAWAGLEDPTHKYVGSMGYLADSGRAYYVTIVGK